LYLSGIESMNKDVTQPFLFSCSLKTLDSCINVLR
jgi:hypothetical protein